MIDKQQHMLLQLGSKNKKKMTEMYVSYLNVLNVLSHQDLQSTTLFAVSDFVCSLEVMSVNL